MSDWKPHLTRGDFRSDADYQRAMSIQKENDAICRAMYAKNKAKRDAAKAERLSKEGLRNNET